MGRGGRISKPGEKAAERALLWDGPSGYMAQVGRPEMGYSKSAGGQLGGRSHARQKRVSLSNAAVNGRKWQDDVGTDNWFTLQKRRNGVLFAEYPEPCLRAHRSLYRSPTEENHKPQKDHNTA